MVSDFGKIGFSGKLRPSQVASSGTIRKELENDSKELLIVAPPGSGKTVLGLYVWSDLCLLYTSPSPRDVEESRMPSSA